MRSLKSGLFGALCASAIVSAAIVGCAESETPEVDGTGVEPTDPTPLPPSNPPGEVPKVDAGKKDASKPDAAKDAGPPPPNPGDACTKVDEVFEKICGKCGKQKAICLADGSGGKVSDYGPCENEIGQCVIGSTQECGNCGTSTCSNSCNWGVCQNQPQNACAKGTTEYSTAGCSAGQYRSRTCDNACQWGNFSTVCAEPNNPNKLVLAGVGATATGTYTLVTTRASKRQPTYTSSCISSTTLSTTTDHPYEIIELHNTTAQTAKVTVTQSSAPSIYMVLAAYPNNLPPQTEAEMKTCTVASTSSLSNVTIPPNTKIVVRAQAYYSPTANPTLVSSGSFTFNVRTDSLQ